MACFVVPGAEAVVTTVATKIIEKKENTDNVEKVARFSSKLKKLNYMLWGGSALLAFEHLWHGEIQPMMPILTAAENPMDFAEMLHEMSTVGVGMAAMVTAVWGVGTFVSSKLVKRNQLSREVSK